MLFVCDIQGVSFLVRCRNGQMQLWAFAAKEVSFLAARQKQYWMNLKVKQQGNRPWQPRLESPDVPNILMADSFVIADDEVFLLLLSPIFGRHFETITYSPIASRTWCIKKHAENQLAVPC